MSNEPRTPLAGKVVLYVGEMLDGSTSLQRCEAIERQGCRVVRLATRASQIRAPLAARIMAAAYRNGIELPTPDPLDVNDRLAQAIVAERPDLLWLDKALAVIPQTLRNARAKLPALVIAGYSPDDMGQRHNRSTAFGRHLPLYDIFFTTKSYGVAELRALGCRNPVFVANAYDPALHRPLDLGQDERERFGGPITFIGSYEPERASAIAAIVDAGLPVRVWGAGWPDISQFPSGMTVEGRALYGEDYVRTLCASDINLCFLRKLNRDQQTTRSVEIPACGAFMLAERTSEHEALFTEGQEAEYFAGIDELIAKCFFYLKHPDKRASIAAAGLARCRRDGYSNDQRMKSMLEKSFAMEARA
ncbi:CgeB family protein [Novosphingobium beihaiensis]|uniref:Glycosyltransferase n=1 Tax=Novosphingobium beihaiensis TaxID=2930389 RepID=A0ABT0BUI0_9SPHN|nr:glycosyltransferase [Novosphingobium beihaiensis]MCJ2188721.1 glycosyltransferase [Novosphingobium beihaiensis]